MRTATKGLSHLAEVLLFGLLVSSTLGCTVRRGLDQDLSSSTDEPQYGGEINIATVYYTLSALSWDTRDWNWKLNHDAGSIFEHLFAADLDLSVSQGGDYTYRADAWVPEEAMTGELAESWSWESPLTLAIKLREGIRFVAKPGVMEARELTAEDVVYSFERSAQSPKVVGSMVEHVDSVTARDRYTVVFEFNQYRADWAYRFGYGYYSSIVPRELEEVDARDWRNITGTGPFMIDSFISGNSQKYVRNPDYWGTTTIQNKEYQLPFLDGVNYRVIRDEATQLTALRTGKLDIAEAVRWIAVDHLKETTPELQWTKSVAFVGTFLSMRVDQEPFDDVRVRRALNMAVDKQAIVDKFWGGNAELFAFPMHPDYKGFFQPLEQMPESVQELFRYDPEEAKRLLAEAGLEEGFRFKTQVTSANPPHMELAPLIADNLAAVGGRDGHRAARVHRLPLLDDKGGAWPWLPARQRTRLTPRQPVQELPHRPAMEPVDVV